MVTIRVKISPAARKLLKARATANRRSDAAEAGLILEVSLRMHEAMSQGQTEPDILTRHPIQAPEIEPEPCQVGWPIPPGPTCGTGTKPAVAESGTSSASNPESVNWQPDLEPPAGAPTCFSEEPPHNEDRVCH